MLKVEEVVVKAAQHLLHGVGIAIVKRGIACHARSYLIEKGVTRVVHHYLVNVILALGSIAYERHVAAEHVPQLWQLVKVVRTDEASHLSKARVVIATSVREGRLAVLNIDAH